MLKGKPLVTGSNLMINNMIEKNPELQNLVDVCRLLGYSLVPAISSNGRWIAILKNHEHYQVTTPSIHISDMKNLSKPINSLKELIELLH